MKRGPTSHYSVHLRMQMYTEPVPLNYGNLATEYPRIYRSFFTVQFDTSDDCCSVITAGRQRPAINIVCTDVTAVTIVYGHYTTSMLWGNIVENRAKSLGFSHICLKAIVFRFMHLKAQQ